MNDAFTVDFLLMNIGISYVTTGKIIEIDFCHGHRSPHLIVLRFLFDAKSSRIT
jgi:hypothetical protein